MVIQFLIDYRIYKKGECAGFSPTISNWLIERKVAKPFVGEKQAKDIKSMTYKDLQEKAKELGIQYVGIKKEKLIEAIKEVI